MKTFTRLLLASLCLCLSAGPATAQFNKVYTYYWSSSTPARSVLLDLVPGNPNAATEPRRGSFVYPEP